MCKVSGIVTEADHQAWTPDDLRPYLDVVFEAFGPERLMWGSDWPVCLLAGSYERVFRVIDDYASALSAGQRAALFGGNCARFYSS
jgi:L-fuconolactonase